MSDSAAISLLWVTIIKVCPNLSTQSLKNFITSSVVLLSKFPVGSSANIISGLFDNALAIATLCCCPPESGYSLFLIISTTDVFLISIDDRYVVAIVITKFVMITTKYSLYCILNIGFIYIDEYL